MTRGAVASTGSNESLLRALMHAETEAEVVRLLEEAGYWTDDAAWRYYNDEPDNFDRAGNQQRNPEAALVEKLVNSVDANLLRRALERGLDPRSPEAPRSPREAVAVFYEDAQLGEVRAHQGSLAEWPDGRRREIARDITLALTGRKPEQGYPSISIADSGEGQSPDRLPTTILSLSKGIKKAIPFVQGRFNMGGTGALRFCGQRNLQLVVSKRLPPAAAVEGVSRAWGFTIVRRDDPTEDTKVSTYRYLAPVGSVEHPKHGEVLCVEREALPIFPEGQEPYKREATWGTLLKLYEYKTRARTHMFRRGGLQERLDILLPGLVLPIRLHECRDYKGQERSFETTLTGLEVRLADRDGRSANIEADFPDSGRISIKGQEIGCTIYAFKTERAQTYKRGEGVLFVLGGQTHAAESDRFFRRKDVGMSYLAPSLLVILECSRLAGRTIEDLFMNSRDRLADEELAHEILDELADVIRTQPGLRLLRERRRQEDIAGKIADERPLQDVLEQLLKRSPALAQIFLVGTRLSNPFASADAPVAEKFVGKDHPTYFHFKDHKSGEGVTRPAYIGQRFRLTFETDVENEFFRRSLDPGELEVKATLNGEPVQLTSTMNLFNGLAHLNVTLPENTRVGDRLRVTVIVTDWVVVEEFVNHADVDIHAAIAPSSGGFGKRDDHRPKNTEGSVEPRPAGIAFPEVQWAYKADWNREAWITPMNEFSGMRATLADAADELTGVAQYDFWVNADNIFLQTELKATKQDPELVRAKFKYGMTLVGLGALRRASELKGVTVDSLDLPGRDVRSNGQSGEELVAMATDVVAPMLLPMIDGLGGLELEEAGVDQSPDAQDLADSLSD